MEKLLLSGHVVLFALSALYALRSVGRGSGFLTLLALPFALNYLVHMGFWNFSLGVSLSLLLIGFVFRRRGRVGRRDWGILCGLSLLTLVAHVFPLLMAFGVGLLVAAWDGLRRALAGRPARPALTVALALTAVVPAVLIGLPFTNAERMAAGLVDGTEDTPTPAWQLARLGSLLAFSLLASFDRRELLVGAAVATTFAALGGYVLVGKWRRRRAEASDALLLAALACVGLSVWKSDPASQALFVPTRLAVYVYLLVLLWLAGWDGYGPTPRRLAVGAGTAATVVLLVLHGATYRAVDVALADYLSGSDLVEPGATLLSLAFDQYGVDAAGRPLSYKVTPFALAGAYVALQRRAINLGNDEGSTTHFPLRWRPELDPVRLLAAGRGIFRSPPQADFLDYERRTGGRGRVEYVLVYGLRDGSTPEAASQPILEQLHAGYERVHVSPSGRATLWRRVRPPDEVARVVIGGDGRDTCVGPPPPASSF